jgi:putative two-component system response regulator
MLIDDNLTYLATGKQMLKDYYEVYDLPSANKLFEFLEKVVPDLILLDVEMPGIDGYETCKRLKGDPRFEEIPVIFVTSKTDEINELKGLSLGAVDYVSKPFSAPRLLKRIENQILISRQRGELLEQSLQLKTYSEHLEDLVSKKVGQLLEIQTALLNTVAELVEYRDDPTGGHPFRIRRYLELLVDELIAKRLYRDEIRTWNVDLLLSSSKLHDVGKITIDDVILKKPAKLTDEEFEKIQEHAIAGVKIIERIEGNTKENDFLRYAKIIAGTHHEKWDGTGYPHGLKGEDIPLEGRLMAIADVYDALVSERPYKQPLSHAEAMRIIKEASGTHFDPTLVYTFVSLADKIAAVPKDERDRRK